MPTTHINCVVMVPHVDEGKSARPTRLVIIDDLNLFHWTVVFEDLTQVTFLCVQAQAKHSEAAARLRILLGKEQQRLDGTPKTSRHIRSSLQNYSLQKPSLFVMFICTQLQTSPTKLMFCYVLSYQFVSHIGTWAPMFDPEK